MDDEVAQIRHALETVLAPGASAEQRRAAQDVCDAVQAHPRAAEYGLALAGMPGQPLAARIFGLNTVEHVVRTRLDLGSAEPLRDAAWALLPGVVSAPASERRILQEKTASVIAQLAVRIWPQYWPDLFPSLLALVPGDGIAHGGLPDAGLAVRGEMALLMVRTIVDAVHPPAETQIMYMEDERRAELQRALSVVLPPLVARLQTLLPLLAEARVAGSAFLGSLLRASLGAYASAVQWAPLVTDAGAEAVANVIRTSVNLVAVPEDAGDALDALQRLSARQARSPEEHAAMALAVGACIGPLQNMLGALSAELLRPCSSQDAWEEERSVAYDLFKRTADVFATLAASHVATQSASALPTGALDAVLDVALGLSSTPSLLVQCTADTFWAAAVRGAAPLLSETALVARIPRLLGHVLATGAALPREQRRQRPFNAADFASLGAAGTQDDGDFTMLFQAHASRTTELLRQLATAHPALLADGMASALEGVVRAPGGANALTASQWTSLMSAADVVGRVCHIRVLRGADTVIENAVRVHVLRMGDTLLGSQDLFASLDCSRAYAYALGVRGILPALGTLGVPGVPSAGTEGARGAQYFQRGAERLLAWALDFDATPQSRAPDATPDMRAALRGRSATTLQRIVLAQPALVAPSAAHLFGLYRNALSSSALGPYVSFGAPGASQNLAQGHEATAQSAGLRLLLEMLLAAVSESSADARGSLMRSMLSPLVEAHAALSNELSVLAPPVLAQRLVADVSFRRAWALVLCLLCTALRRLDATLSPSGAGALSADEKFADIMPLVHTELVPVLGTAVDASVLAVHRAFRAGGSPGAEGMLRDVFDDRRPALAEDAYDRADRMIQHDSPGVIDALEVLASGRFEPAKAADAARGAAHVLRLGIYAVRGALFVLSPTAAGDYVCGTNVAAAPLDAMLEHAEAFSAVQWALVAKHIVAPMLERSPTTSQAVTRAAIVLCERFGTVHLEAAWGAHHASCAAQRSEDAQREALALESRTEAFLTAATSALFAVLTAILSPVAERDKRPDPFLEPSVLSGMCGSAENARASILELRTLAQAPLVGVAASIVGTPASAARLAAVLSASFRWKPSFAVLRSLPLVSRWAGPLLLCGADFGAAHTHLAADKDVFALRSAHGLVGMLRLPPATLAVHESLLSHVPRALLDVLSATSLSESHAAAAHALGELYKWQLVLGYDTVDAAIRAAPLWCEPSAPDAVISELRALYAPGAVRTAPAAPSASAAKAQRARVRAILGRAVTAHVLATTGVSSSAPRLPDRLVILRKMQALESPPRPEDADLSSLFG